MEERPETLGEMRARHTKEAFKNSVKSLNALAAGLSLEEKYTEDRLLMVITARDELEKIEHEVKWMRIYLESHLMALDEIVQERRR